MLKVVSLDTIKIIEANAKESGISEEMLMDNAGAMIKEEVIRLVNTHNLSNRIVVLAGKGNNGGDAYTAANLLKEHGFPIVVLQVLAPEENSLGFKKETAFLEASGYVIKLDGAEFPLLPKNAVILDGIFGTGFKGKMDKRILSFIKMINASKLPVISIDIPSGVNGDTGEVLDDAICATYTAAIEFPKLGFFLGKGYEYVGKISCLPIGLEPFSQDIVTEFNYLQEIDIVPYLPIIKRTRHKYQAGHVVGLGGSSGMTGASLMAAWSSLRVGCGIVHLVHPKKSSSEIIGQPLEVVRVPFSLNKIDHVRELIIKSNACFIGPGLGRSNEVHKLLDNLWDDFKEKSVIDADALFWLSKKNEEISLSKSILTPHLGEMSTLLGIDSKNVDRHTFLKKVLEFATSRNANIIVKGAPTFLFSGSDPIVIMERGDPGMATAGSGDVLTGILTGLMSQGLSPKNAMWLGSYIHGLVGELAASLETSYCMTATSLIQYLPQVFIRLLSLQKALKENGK